MCDEQDGLIEVVERLAGELLPKEFTLKSAEYDRNRFNLFRTGDLENQWKYPIAGFSLTPFMGCECAAVISHFAWVNVKWQRQGLGTTLLKIRTESIKQAGYCVALATVRSSNRVEKKLLKRAGWKRSMQFPPHNYGGHHVELWALRSTKARKIRADR